MSSPQKPRFETVEHEGETYRIEVDNRSPEDQWRDLARAAMKLRRRHWAIRGLARDRLHLGIGSDGDLFELATGDRTGAGYWRDWLAVTESPRSIAQLLSIHLYPPPGANVLHWVSYQEGEINALLGRAIADDNLVVAKSGRLSIRDVVLSMRSHPEGRELLPPRLIGFLDAPNPIDNHLDAGAGTPAATVMPMVPDLSHEPREPARSKPLRDRARVAITSIWPNGVPSNVTNSEIVDAVGRHLRDQTPERTTILRAAGRRK